MSGFPSPYSTPNVTTAPNPYAAQHLYAQNPYAELLAPSRRAAIATFIVAAIVLLGGLCFGAMVFMPDDVMEKMLQNSGQSEATPQIMRVGLVVLGVIGALAGIALGVLGFFVWRGSLIATILATVGVGLMILLMLLNAVVSLPNARGLGGPELAMFACFTVLVPLLLVGLFVMLIFAAKGTTRYKAAIAQYQTHYYHYQQQQQQAYQQQYYNYTQQQPPAAPQPPQNTPLPPAQQPSPPPIDPPTDSIGPGQ